MDRGAWQATVHGVARVGQDLATKQQQQIPYAYLVPPTPLLPMVVTRLFSISASLFFFCYILLLVYFLDSTHK